MDGRNATDPLVVQAAAACSWASNVCKMSKTAFHVWPPPRPMQGSGLSQGQWVTLGCREVEDLEVAVAYLRGSGRVTTIALWGRSMGAVTSLLYS